MCRRSQGKSLLSNSQAGDVGPLFSIPYSSRMIGIVIARLIVYLPVESLDTATHGVRVVNVDVVVLSIRRLLHKRLLDLDSWKQHYSR